MGSTTLHYLLGVAMGLLLAVAWSLVRPDENPPEDYNCTVQAEEYCAQWTHKDHAPYDGCLLSRRAE